MREKSRQENLKRLQQLEEAKTKLGAKDPKVSDINQEIQSINSKLKPIAKNNIPNNVSDEQYGDYFDQQSARSQAQNEPFGQDLNELEKQRQKQKERVAEQVIKNEPEGPSASDAGPQARATAKPAEDISQKTLKPDNKPPGGLASRARNLFSRSNSAGKAGATAEGGAGTVDGASQASKQIVNAATQAAKKAIANTIAKILATNPVTWIVIGVGLVIAIILFIVGISYMGTVNSKKPSTTGGTPLVAVNAKTDSGALQNLLKLSGDKTLTDQAISDALTTMRKNMLETRELNKNNNALVKQINIALGEMDKLQGAKSLNSAKTFLMELGKVYDITEADIPPFPTGNGYSTKAPVNPMTTPFNSTLHGGTFLWPEKISGHGTYTGNNQGMCDAVDVPATKNSPVTPIFGGTVTDVKPDGHNGTKVTIKNGDYQVLYVHLIAVNKKIGNEVSINDIIGVIKTNHVHIEVVYKDKCLITTHADQIDHAMSSRRHQDWGGYLWDRVVKTFGLK